MPTKTKIQWIGTSQCAYALGINPLTLLQKRKEGYFEYGDHYHRKGDGKTSKYFWNLEEVEKVFLAWKAPQKRKG